MPIINSIVNWINFKRIYNIDLFKQYPYNVQKETFIKLISKSRETEWGLKYGYSDKLTIEKFQEKVPLQTYEESSLA
jgi:hypothetical protein